ncbi:MAG: CinA family protein [Bacillota bacterium]
MNNIRGLSKDLVNSLKNKNLKIAFAESMTGGLLASEIIATADASKVIEESFVVYSNEAKQKILSCKKATIEKYSVYSFEVVREMVIGLKQISEADILVAVSGIAGPTADSDRKIGEVFLAIIINEKLYEDKINLTGTRNEIRYSCVKVIFTKILNLIE